VSASLGTIDMRRRLWKPLQREQRTRCIRGWWSLVEFRRGDVRQLLVPPTSPQAPVGEYKSGAPLGVHLRASRRSAHLVAGGRVVDAGIARHPVGRQTTRSRRAQRGQPRSRETTRSRRTQRGQADSRTLTIALPRLSRGRVPQGSRIAGRAC